MKEINVSEVTKAIEDLCIKANKVLPEDLVCTIGKCKECENNNLAKNILGIMEENIDCAKDLDLPVCQDTGMAVIFMEIGQDVHFVGGSLENAVNLGVHNGYVNGYLRKSIVKDPLNRVNTEDNTPAVIHYSFTEGENVRITVAPKGFGSENMSKLYMLTPASGRKEIIEKVKECVSEAGGNPCPPMVIGVGIGGNFESVALLAKKALCRKVSEHNKSEYYKELEIDLLREINSLDIGPQGFGGDTTALAVNVEWAPTHIAGLPLAVNVGCHVTRHASIVL